MTTAKPLIVVTRKLPDVIETRMMELFNARLNHEDRPMTQEGLVEAMFTGFPGNSGETVRISIAPEKTTSKPVR